MRYGMLGDPGCGPLANLAVPLAAFGEGPAACRDEVDPVTIPVEPTESLDRAWHRGDLDVHAVEGRVGHDLEPGLLGYAVVLPHVPRGVGVEVMQAALTGSAMDLVGPR